MALNNAQLQERIEALELAMNDVQTALNNLVSKRQMKALLNIRQSEIDALQKQVASLQEQIAILQQ
jgi:polyhydroxyalkanoate synthesis regulator phasin